MANVSSGPNRRHCRACLAATGLAAACLLLPGAPPALGQPSVSASVDSRTVPLDDTLTLTISAGGSDQVEEPELGPLADFVVVSQFRSQSVNIVGGQTSVSVSFQYVLQPRSEGTREIPSLGVRVAGRVLKTRPITVQVTAARGGTGRPPPTPQAPVLPPRLSPFGAPAETRGDVIVRCETDKQEAYVGEQILLTFSLYYAARPGDVDYQPANTEGFRVQELPAPAPRYEMIDGDRYVVKQDLRLLFPTAPGEHTVSSATVRYTRGFWDPVVETRTTVPITIRVSRLPEAGRPESYCGVVGGLEVRTVLDRDSIRRGEAATLTAIVQGWGNLEAMEAPAISLPAGVREYRSSENRRFEPESVNGGYRVEGEALFDNVIIPTTVGDITIPPIRIGYFDPEVGRYRVARSEPVVLHVEPGEPGTAATMPGFGQPAQLSPLPDRLVSRYVGHLGSGALILSQVLAMAWLIGTGVVRRRRAVLERDPRLARARRALRTAVGRVRDAGKLPPREAAAGIAAALAGYIADRLDVPAATVSPATGEELLASRGAGSDGAPLVELLRTCDSVRFSPATEADVAALADRALQLLRGLERHTKTGRSREPGGRVS